MRNRNWRQYNKHLVQQGSISFLIDPKIFKSMQKNQRLKGRGRPIQFSDALIEMLLMIKTQSFLIPTYSLICKRVGSLKLELPTERADRSLVIILSDCSN